MLVVFCCIFRIYLYNLNLPLQLILASFVVKTNRQVNYSASGPTALGIWLQSQWELPLTWHGDCDGVGGGGPGLVGDGADVVSGVFLGNAAQEESLVEDVDIVFWVFIQYRALEGRVRSEMQNNERKRCKGKMFLEELRSLLIALLVSTVMLHDTI